MTPLITVIVPVYNAEKYIARCISSIQRQTYSNLEIIVINDGSSDRSGEILEKFKRDDDRIILYHRENEGSSAARNFGLEKAQGVYIGFVDADDWIETTMFESMYQRMILDSAQMVTCGEDRYYEETNSFETVIALENAVYEGEEAQARVIRNNSGPCNKLYFRELIGSIRFDEELKRAEDTKFIYEVLRRNPKISMMQDILYHYNYTLGSRGNRGFTSATWDVFKVVEYIYDGAMVQSCSMQLRDAVSERLVGGAYRVFREIVQSTARWTDDDEKKMMYVQAKLKREAFHVLRNLKVGFPKKIGIGVMVIFPQMYIKLLSKRYKR